MKKRFIQFFLLVIFIIFINNYLHRCSNEIDTSLQNEIEEGLKNNGLYTFNNNQFSDYEYVCFFPPYSRFPEYLSECESSIAHTLPKCKDHIILNKLPILKKTKLKLILNTIITPETHGWYLVFINNRNFKEYLMNVYQLQPRTKSFCFNLSKTILLVIKYHTQYPIEEYYTKFNIQERSEK